MSPLDLNKDSELVSNEVTEVNENQLTETVSVTEPDTTSQDNFDTAIERNTPVVTANAAVQATDYNQFSKSELVDALKKLITKDITSIKDEVELIKQVYYKKLKNEFDQIKATFIENGGDELDFSLPKDETEAEFKELLNQYRIRKASIAAQIEKEKENNLIQKQHILGQMKLLVDSNDDVSVHINDFKLLQQKWKSIGQVPLSYSNEIWKQYNLYQEAFWDLIKINNEMREYDFKKNLEAKTAICETAEKLAESSDIVSSFTQLQKLHDEWHDLGPVAREMRETIWNRFKEASSVINKKHQAHFEDIRKLEENNAELKNELCGRLEALTTNMPNSFKEWDEVSQNVLAIQEEWRTIGFAPRKVNQKLFDRYRKACDEFFRAKGEFYKHAKSIQNKNAELKIALCEQAEALKDSQDWKETTDKFIQLQKEWKRTGSAGKRISDDLWKRFLKACNYFFDQKNKVTRSERSGEELNLEKKIKLIEEINALENCENNNETLVKLRSLIAEWSNIGFVPFKEKDRIYKEYRNAVDKQFEKLNVDSTNRRMDHFKSNLKDMSAKGDNKLYKERDKLMHAYEHLKSEIATYENNIGFFSSSSNKGNKLIKEMERKIESLKEESKLIEQKINLIDENL